MSANAQLMNGQTWNDVYKNRWTTYRSWLIANYQSLLLLLQNVKVKQPEWWDVSYYAFT